MADVEMRPWNAIGAPYVHLVKNMIEKSGRSAAEISRDIGRSSNYISSMVYNMTVPRADLLADIAHACGYELQLVGHGETLDVPGGQFRSVIKQRQNPSPNSPNPSWEEEFEEFKERYGLEDADDDVAWEAFDEYVNDMRKLSSARRKAIRQPEDK